MYEVSLILFFKFIWIRQHSEELTRRIGYELTSSAAVPSSENSLVAALKEGLQLDVKQKSDRTGAAVELSKLPMPRLLWLTQSLQDELFRVLTTVAVDADRLLKRQFTKVPGYS